MLIDTDKIEPGKKLPRGVVLRPRYLRTEEVIQLTGLSRTSIYKFGKSGLFPKPIKIGTTSRFDYYEVIAAMKALRVKDEEEVA